MCRHKSSTYIDLALAICIAPLQLTQSLHPYYSVSVEQFYLASTRIVVRRVRPTTVS